ncbi:MAG: response regulator [bacterium]|nr:response regulator [bacterium]
MNTINKKILIVEDNKDYSFILKTSFEKENFSTVIAQNGEEGLSLIEKENPDLILLDLQMPIMDGWEMAQKMKEKNIIIPIIFLTDHKDPNYISRAIEIIPTDYMLKAETLPDNIVSEAKKKLGIK